MLRYIFTIVCFTSLHKVINGGEVLIGGIFGVESSGDDSHDYYAIMNSALWHTNPDRLTGSNSRLSLDITYDKFTHLWQANNFVCDWVKTHRASALLVTEDLCTSCFDITATLVQATYPIFSIDHGSLGSRAFNMNPSPEDMNEMFFDVISYYKWTEFFVLFDTQMVFRNLQPFLNKAADRKWHLQFVDVDDEDKETWTELIRESNFRNILIYCGTEDMLTTTIMNAIDYGLMETDYHWIIGNPDVYYNETHAQNLLDVDAYITNFRMTVDTSAAFSTFNLVFHGEWTLRQKLVFDTISVLTNAVISYSDEMKLKFPGRSLSSLIPGDTIMTDCEENWSGMPRNPLTNHFTQNLQLQGLTGNIAFNEMGNRVNYSMSIYSGKGGSLDIMRGEWIQNHNQWEQLYNDELAAEVVHLSIDPTWTAGDEIFVVGSVMVSPFMMDVELDYSSTYLEDNVRFEGYIPDLMVEISNVLLNEGLNFEYELAPYDDGSYGYKDLNSEEWSGVIGAVINQEIDVAAGPLTITDKREEEVDFTVPFGESPVQILVKHPSHIYNTQDFSFTFPLGTEVWCANLVAMFLVASLLWTINRCSPTEWAIAARRGKVHPDNEDNFNFKNALWFVTSSAFLQSYDASPRSNAGRIGAAVWWVFSLLMLSSYCLNLSNYMYVNKQQAFCRTSRDLLQQTEIVYGCVKEGSTYSMLENTKHGDLRSIYEYMFTNIYESYVSDIGAGIERVRESNGKYAFLAEMALVLNEITEAPCNVYLVPEAVGTVSYGLAVQPGSPLRDQLSYAINVLKENGVLADLEAKWFRPESDCDDQLTNWNNQGLYSLTIVDLKGVYYMLLIGVAITLAFFFLELMCYLLRSPRHFLPVSNCAQLQRSKENVSNEDETNFKDLVVELDPTDRTSSSAKPKQWL